jgi:hypothetical protein
MSAHEHPSLNIMTTPTHFELLLQTATQMSEPQRLLFVFTTAGLPDNASARDRERYFAGVGGTLTPIMCVDKSPTEIADFEALVTESRRAGPSWDVVFVAALAGTAGQPPGEARVEAALQTMVESVRVGSIRGLAAYDKNGCELVFG